MASKLNLDYYYSNEAEQYSFYRFPKVLLTDPRYKSISVEAKVLYGLLLDRMSLSVRNGWLDSDGRVYIYFTQEDAMSLIGCGKDKATRLFRELDDYGIGLIERKKQGQGRPTRIYVKNFTLPPEPGENPPPQTPPEQETPQPHDPVQTAENQQSGQREDTALLTAEKPQSAPLENRSQDCANSAANKTDKKETDLSNTDLSSYPPTPAPSVSAPAGRTKLGMRMDEMERYREIIRENIGYDRLVQDKPYDQDVIDGYVELMVEVCCTRRDFIRIAGDEVASGVVKSRFLKLNQEHISYVLESLGSNTTLVKNIKAYTLAALYNAPNTIGQYYASLVSHDLAQDAVDSCPGG